jgi:long-subunit acyl-CoA synthetase (AMP-forming)
LGALLELYRTKKVSQNIQTISGYTQGELNERIESQLQILREAGVSKGCVVLCVFSGEPISLLITEMALSSLDAIPFPVSFSVLRWIYPKFQEHLQIDTLVTDSITVSRFCRKHSLISSKAILVGKESVEIEVVNPASGPIHYLNQHCDIANLLLTSGSLGSSKIIALSNENIALAYQEFAAIDVIKEAKSYFSILPLTFSGGRKVHYSCLHSGLSIAYYNSGLSMEENLKDRLFDLTAGTPWHLKQIVNCAPPFKSKVTFICGGAPLEEELYFAAESNGIRVISVYGLTETSSILSYNTFKDHARESVGKVSPSLRINILQSDEIAVKGPVISPGQIQFNKLCPLTDEEGWLKTGDMGYINDDGFLFLTGRVGNLAKLSTGIFVDILDMESVMKGLLPDMPIKIWVNNHGEPVMCVFCYPDDFATKRNITEAVRTFNGHYQEAIKLISLVSVNHLKGLDNLKQTIPLEFVQNINSVYLPL